MVNPVELVIGPQRAYAWTVVTLREFEDRDRPKRAVAGMPDDVAPPEWTPAPMTNPQKAFHVARGVPAVLGVLKGLIAALGSALR